MEEIFLVLAGVGAHGMRQIHPTENTPPRSLPALHRLGTKNAGKLVKPLRIMLFAQCPREGSGGYRRRFDATIMTVARELNTTGVGRFDETIRYAGAHTMTMQG